MCSQIKVGVSIVYGIMLIIADTSSEGGHYIFIFFLIFLPMMGSSFH